MSSAKTGIRFKLTTASVRERCRPPREGEVTASGRQVLYRFYWDTELRGFALVVGARTQTFVVQKDVRGRSVRVTIGRLGAWTVDQARKRARELVVQMDSGVDPNQREREESARGITLAEAVEMFLSTMRAKSCAPRSLQVIRDECRRHLSDWLPRSLSSITRNECAQRHERITERSGRYAANRVLQNFRACYNTAARRMDDLPPNPVVGVTFNKTRRRREPVPWAQLPAWRARVDAIANPIRRDLQLLLLFTGLRSADARTIQWEHVDFERGTLPSVATSKAASRGHPKSGQSSGCSRRFMV